VLGSAFASVGYLFSNSMGSISLMLFLLAFVLNYKNLNFSIKKILNSPTVSLVLFFLFIIICSFYSENTNQAQKEVVRFLSFLIYPIIFTSIAPFNLKERRSIILLFIISLMLFFFICLTVSIQRQITFWNEGGHFNWYFFYRYDFLEVFNQHPTYVSLFTLLALCFLHFLPEKEMIIKNSFTNGLLSVVLIFSIILYGSRIGYILLMLLGVIYLIRLIKCKKIKELSFVLITFLILLITAWNIPIVKERILFTAGENYNYKYNDKEEVSIGTEEQGRLLMWRDALELIKEKPLLGYGTGASRQVLLDKYEEKGHHIFLEGRYNAHNTYLELLLWGGVILLVIYLVYLGLLFYQSIIKKDLLLFLFFLIISIAGITETIFIAQGIMFAAFFYCFLNQKYLKDETD
jgi:O-antigen ligase